LCSITYVNSIKVLTGKNQDNVIEAISEKQHKRVHIPVQNYDNIKMLLDSINSHIISEREEEARFSYNEILNRTKLIFGHKSKLKISETLSYILGFNGKTYFHEIHEINDVKYHYLAESPPDLTGKKYHLFVYTDIIESQVVGSSLVPMLRMVNIKHGKGEAITETFQNPYYLKLNRSTIDSISIIICDEFGEEILFDSGQVTVTLHFRKKLKR